MYLLLIERESAISKIRDTDKRAQMRAAESETIFS
jgi:hypothetical protein